MCHNPSESPESMGGLVGLTLMADGTIDAKIMSTLASELKSSCQADTAVHM